MTEHTSVKPAREDTAPRRGFLGLFSLLAMGIGLIAGYGMLAFQAVRFLYPTKRGKKAWQFVSTLDALRTGDALPFTTPSGAKIVVARQGDAETADQFVALSSVCPHLGCAVHWEAQNDRFFCPCHNGAFDASGKATEGPPKTANQELAKYPLKVENGLLYIEISTDAVASPTEGRA